VKREWELHSISQAQFVTVSSTEYYVFRLRENDKLKESILEFAQHNDIKAGTILSSVGSLKTLNVRLAGAEITLNREEDFEILSLNGTFNNTLEGHFHISVSDKEGNCIGGHLLTQIIQ